MILLYYFSTTTFPNCLFLLYFLYYLFIYFYFSLSFCHTLLGTFLSIKWILVLDIWNFIFMWNCKMILLIVRSISLKVYSLHFCIYVMIIIWMIIWINCTKYYFITGPSQPDEDDYGYESQAASALYNQFMSKYNSLPLEKPIFSISERKAVKDIASTKVHFLMKNLKNILKVWIT